MPTLQDVARHAGVSTATVSKVISGTPYVSAPTAAKVRESIKAIGYRPNLAARALSSGKTYMVAVIFPFVYDALFKDPLVMQILEGIESVCTEHHYNILLSTPRMSENGFEHYQRVLWSGYLEGVIAIDNVEVLSFADEALSIDIPTVVIGYHEIAYSVRSDDFKGGRLAMQHILAQGHEHIGIIRVPAEMNVPVQQRLAGMHAAASEAGIEFDALPCVTSDFSIQGGAHAAQQLLNEKPDLTAIVSVNDRMAIGAVRHLIDMGKRVPEDISVIGYDDITLAATSHPLLTTISQDAVQLGRAAAQLLFEILDDQSPDSVVLPPRLVQRSTVAQHTHKPV